MNTKKIYDDFLRTQSVIDSHGNRVLTYTFKEYYLKDRNARMSVDDAFRNVYLPIRTKQEKDQKAKEKLHAKLEREVSKGKITKSRSNQSESEYYYKDGFTFRFSGHRHPTGSMTNIIYDGNGKPIGGVIDMTDNDSIDKVKKYTKINIGAGNLSNSVG